MKQLKIMPILLIACLLIAAIAVYSIIAGITGGYNPNRYIQLGPYENLSVTVEQLTAEKEDIEAALNLTLQQLATQQEVTDGAKEGDVVSIDYVGSIGGKQNDVFTGQDVDVTLGQNGFVVDGMDEALFGTVPGQKVTTTLTVQENYLFEEYVGQRVTFAVTVNTVTRSVTPQLTDQLAAELGDYQTVEEFKTAFEEQYKQSVAQQNKVAVHTELWTTVVDNTQVEGYPSKELNQLKEEFRAQLEAEAKEYDMEFIDYASYACGGLTTMEEFEEYSTQYQQEILKQQMVLKAICKKEKIKLTEEDYAASMAEYLELFQEEGHTEEDLLEAYGGRQGMEEQFLRDKVVQFIEQTATVTVK